MSKAQPNCPHNTKFRSIQTVSNARAKSFVEVHSALLSFVATQILNSLVMRQILPKGPNNFELIFNFFGYSDDTAEMRAHRIKQANLVGPAGLISMEDTLATELIRFGTASSGDAPSMADMGRDASDEEQNRSMISENRVRQFWRGYQELMGL